MEILEKTGIMVVPGSGFGQKPGTSHFRVTNLVDDYDEMSSALKKLGDFTEELMSSYK